MKEKNASGGVLPPSVISHSSPSDYSDNLVYICLHWLSRGDCYLLRFQNKHASSSNAEFTRLHSGASRVVDAAVLHQQTTDSVGELCPAADETATLAMQ